MHWKMQGASCLARSLKVVNEALSSLDLGFNEIRVCIDFVFSVCFFSHFSSILHNLKMVLYSG